MTGHRKTTINDTDAPSPADDNAPPRTFPASPEMTATIACFTPVALQRLPLPLQTIVHDATWTSCSYAD